MPLPSEADQVVIEGFLLDEITGGGLAAEVKSEPIALPGQAPVPMVLDAVSHAHIQTRARTTTPDPTTGYWALMALSTNDPDLEAYGGRRVTLPGQTARDIEVPYNATQKTVTSAMAAQLNPQNLASLPRVNDTVRAIWFHQAAGYVAPTPTNAYLTSQQTIDLIASAIGSGGGSGGGGDLPEYSPSAQSAAVAASGLVGKLARFNTTAGTIAQPLPPATTGRQVAVGWDAGANPLTVTADGTDVIGPGSATGLTLPWVGGSLLLHCTNPGRWRVVGGFIPRAALDTVLDSKRTGRLTVFRAGNEILARHSFDATRDLLQPFNLAGTWQAGQPTVRMVSDTNRPVQAVPSTYTDDQVWPLQAANVAGVSTIGVPTDDNCPIRAGWGTVGGNHAWPAGCTVTGAHDKTSADLGSTWSDGTRTYTLLRIPDGSTLIFGGPYTVASGVVTGDLTGPAATLTHVAGAAHTTSVPVTSVSAATQLYPSIFAQSAQAYLDGRIMGPGKASGDVLTIQERYSIVSYKALIDWARANIGSDPFAAVAAGSIAAWGRIQNTYRQDANGLVITQQFTAVEATTLSFNVVQCSPVPLPSGGSRKQFMPGVGTVNGLALAGLADLAAQSGYISLTSANMTLPGYAPDRMEQWAYDSGGQPVSGLQFGYLPVGACDHAKRLVNAGSYLWDINDTTKKNYPYAMRLQPVAAGQTVTGSGFRRWLPAPDVASAPVISRIDDGSNRFVVVDWVGSGAGQAFLPGDIANTQLVPVTAATLLVPSEVGGGALAYAATASPGYGMWAARPKSVAADVVRNTGALWRPGGAGGQPGHHYFCNSALGSTASNGNGNGVVRASPWVVTQPLSIAGFFAEFTVAGDAASICRIGVWADDGLYRPGPVVWDGGSISTGTGNAGTVATGGTPGIYLVPASLVLQPGLYWVAGVVQGAAGTNPTMRLVGSDIPTVVPMSLGTALPAAGTHAAASITLNSMPGALSTPTAWVTSPSGNGPRIGYKVAA